MVSISPLATGTYRTYTGGSHTLNKVSFKGTPDKNKNDYDDPKNPINKFGEYCSAVQQCFYKSLKTGYKTFTQVAYFGALTTTSSDDIGYLLAVSSIIGLVVAVGTLITELPKNLYEAHVNFFTKKEQANADLASYETETALFKQINKKAKTSDEKEKEQLAIDLLKVKKAETGVRDYKNFSPFN